MTSDYNRPATREEVRALLERVAPKVVFRASGRKSSEGDGRTAEDIRRELAASDTWGDPTKET